MEIIKPQGIAPPSAAYAHAVRSGDLLFLAGEVGLEPDGTIAVGDLETQTRWTIRNMEATLKAAGFELTNVVQTTAYLTDIGTFPTFDAVYRELFGAHRPARATVRAELVRSEFLVEIQAIAAR
jgi:2-iminobutanoate/2-iminopropanoate deaminase